MNCSGTRSSVSALSLICQWSVNDLSVICQWSDSALSMVCQWSDSALSVICPRFYTLQWLRPELYSPHPKGWLSAKIVQQPHGLFFILGIIEYYTNYWQKHKRKNIKRFLWYETGHFLCQEVSSVRKECRRLGKETSKKECCPIGMALAGTCCIPGRRSWKDTLASSSSPH